MPPPHHGFLKRTPEIEICLLTSLNKSKCRRLTKTNPLNLLHVTELFPEYMTSFAQGKNSHQGSVKWSIGLSMLSEGTHLASESEVFGFNREKRCVNNNYPHYGLWGFQQRLSMYFYVFYAWKRLTQHPRRVRSLREDLRNNEKSTYKRALRSSQLSNLEYSGYLLFSIPGR